MTHVFPIVVVHTGCERLREGRGTSGVSEPSRIRQELACETNRLNK